MDFEQHRERRYRVEGCGREVRRRRPRHRLSQAADSHVKSALKNTRKGISHINYRAAVPFRTFHLTKLCLPDPSHFSTDLDRLERLDRESPFKWAVTKLATPN